MKNSVVILNNVPEDIDKILNEYFHCANLLEDLEEKLNWFGSLERTKESIFFLLYPHLLKSNRWKDRCILELLNLSLWLHMEIERKKTKTSYHSYGCRMCGSWITMDGANFKKIL